MPHVVAATAYAGGKRLGEVPLEDISEVLKQPDRFVWIDLREPDEPLLRQVQEEFGLHDLAVEDAHLAHERPKLERYGESLFVVLRTARRGGAGVEFGEVHCFVGERYLVSVSHRAAPDLGAVRARCEAAPELLARGPGFPLYAVTDFVVDQHFPVVEALEDELETLEGEVFGEAFSRETTTRVYRLQRDLLEVKRGVLPLVDMANRLAGADLPLVPDAVRPYFRDVYDHAIRINEMVDTVRELLVGVLGASLSLTALAQNEAVKRLAAWAAIIAVPTFVASVYGMSFRHMPELGWTFGYPGVMAVMGAAAALLYWGFKRSNWL
jgi:magnesium transporter